jgi:hypothetical protein
MQHLLFIIIVHEPTYSFIQTKDTMQCTLYWNVEFANDFLSIHYVIAYLFINQT